MIFIGKGIFNDSIYVSQIYGGSNNVLGNFHTLNKDTIWTTVAATLHEVDRIQQADAIKIQTLETQVAYLLTRVTDT